MQTISVILSHEGRVKFCKPCQYFVIQLTLLENSKVHGSLHNILKQVKLLKYLCKKWKVEQNRTQIFLYLELLAGDSVELVCRSAQGHPVPDLSWAYQLDGQAIIQVRQFISGIATVKVESTVCMTYLDVSTWRSCRYVKATKNKAVLKTALPTHETPT